MCVVVNGDHVQVSFPRLYCHTHISQISLFGMNVKGYKYLHWHVLNQF